MCTYKWKLKRRVNVSFLGVAANLKSILLINWIGKRRRK